MTVKNQINLILLKGKYPLRYIRQIHVASVFLSYISTMTMKVSKALYPPVFQNSFNSNSSVSTTYDICLPDLQLSHLSAVSLLLAHRTQPAVCNLYSYQAFWLRDNISPQKIHWCLDYIESQMSIHSLRPQENASGKWKTVIVAHCNDKNGQKYNLFTDHLG